MGARGVAIQFPCLGAMCAIHMLDAIQPLCLAAMYVAAWARQSRAMASLPYSLSAWSR